MHASGFERALMRVLEVACAESVDQHANPHAPSCRACQCRGDAAPGVVVVEDVGFEEDFAVRAVDRLFQRREVLHAADQQLDVVARQQTGHRAGRTRRAVSAA